MQYIHQSDDFTGDEFASERVPLEDQSFADSENDTTRKSASLEFPKVKKRIH